MWPDRVSNPGSLTYELGALPTALHGPVKVEQGKLKTKQELRPMFFENEVKT